MSDRRFVLATASSLDSRSGGRWDRCRSNCPNMGVESRLLSSQVHLKACQRASKAAKCRVKGPPAQDATDMKSIARLLPPLALVGALALVPVTTSSFAAADTTSYQELEKFMSVYERVKANYVEPVDDHTLSKGAIGGMLSALDPHSSYVEASGFDQLR